MRKIPWASLPSSTPTLQETTTAGNETTNPIIIRQSATRWIEIGNDGSYKQYDTLSDVYPQPLYLLGDGYTNCSVGDYRYNIDPYSGWFLDGINFPITVNQKAFTFNPTTGGQLALTADIKTPIAGVDITIDNTDPSNPIINFAGSGANIAALDPTTDTSDVLDSVLQNLFDFFLAKDGSNTAVTLDLQAVGQGITGIFVKGAAIEINTVSDIKKAIISSNLLTATRVNEMPNYDGTLTTEGYVNSNIKTPIAGIGITIDNTDPINPVISTTSIVRELGTYDNAVTAVTTATVTLAVAQPDANYLPMIMPKTELGSIGYYISATTTTSFDVTYPSALTGTLIFGYTINRN